MSSLPEIQLKFINAGLKLSFPNKDVIIQDGDSAIISVIEVLKCLGYQYGHILKKKGARKKGTKDG